MLTRRDLLNRIDEIVERSYLGFMFYLLGEDVLSDEQKRQVEGLGLIIGRRPLIELLYILVRNRPTEGYKKDATLNQLLDQIASTGILPVINDTHQATLDNGKASMFEAIESTKSELKKQVTQKINQINRQYKQDVAAAPMINLEEQRKKEQKYENMMLAAVAAAATGLHSNFVRAFTTSMTDIVNDSVVDNITQAAMLETKDPGKTLVYKEVVNDGRLCQWCDEFYVGRDGKPIIYTLQELQANGSNYGRPKSSWKPVLEATHPHCRCQLHTLSDAKRRQLGR